MTVNDLIDYLKTLHPDTVVRSLCDKSNYDIIIEFNPITKDSFHEWQHGSVKYLDIGED